MFSVSIVFVVALSCCLCQEFNVEVFNITTVALSSTSSGSNSTRIIGGTPASIERYPYTVQILLNNQLSCGGSLLTRRHVMSAAHCFVDVNGNLQSTRIFRIRAGTSTLNTGGSVHSVSRIILHELYDTPTHDNDIAVLLLSSSVTLSDHVATARIPQQGNVVPDNVTVVHVGWGVTNPNSNQVSSILNEVAVRKVNREVCRQRYLMLQTLTGDPFPVTENMICAGLLDIGGKDACQGDSGGPLIYNGVVVGVTSWGFGCAQPYFPGVSARVASYTNWINRTVSVTMFVSGTSSVGPTLGIIILLTLNFMILNR